MDATPVALDGGLPLQRLEFDVVAATAESIETQALEHLGRYGPGRVWHVRSVVVQSSDRIGDGDGNEQIVLWRATVVAVEVARDPSAAPRG